MFDWAGSEVLLKDDDAVGRRNSHKAALRLAVVCKVRRPLPVIEQIQQLTQTDSIIISTDSNKLTNYTYTAVSKCK